MSGMVTSTIKRVKYRYLRVLDTKHWDEFAETPTEDVNGDYGQSLGEALRISATATHSWEFMKRSGSGDHHRTSRRPS